MYKKIAILGSTGSVGETTLKIIRRDKKKFKIILLTTNTSVKKIYKQSIEFNVKMVVIYNLDCLTNKYIQLFKKNNIKIYHTLDDALKKTKKKIYFTISAISGLDGLEPTLQSIKYTKNLGMANKESIICGWKFLNKELKKNNTNFIPLDSEHFSIWSLLQYENKNNIKKIYLTASGGPFLYKKLVNIKNVKPKHALRHPNWKMGKKISIDSATMMNKIFEIIEAKTIFNLKINKFDIIIHPQSYIHAIVHFKTGIIKLLAHDTTMEIPIMNSLYEKNDNFFYNKKEFPYYKLNGINFIKPNIKNFPLINLLKLNYKNTYLEIILISINDMLVKMYLENKISYFSIHSKLLKMIKNSNFTKYYNISPKNINQIKNMIKTVNKYLNKHIKIV